MNYLIIFLYAYSSLSLISSPPSLSQGVENVYTRHKPYLVDVLENLIKGKLRESQYPFVGDSMADRPQDVIVFIVGGATYAEAFAVAQMNSSNQGMRIVLGSNNILNSER